MYHLSAQQLLSNGGFEKHGQLDCLSCPMWIEKFSNTLPSWKNLNGSYPYICDCQYKRDKTAITENICPFDKVMPHQGNTMMQLEFMPSCYDQELKTQGCSSYLGTYLPKPLEIGKVYEISFWVFLLPSKDADYAPFIGFNLYPQALSNPKGAMLTGPAFYLDTVQFNTWYQVKKYIRPTCMLQFMAFGVFRGTKGPPINNNEHRSFFFLDDITVKQVEDSPEIRSSVTPFCKFTTESQVTLLPEIVGKTVYFASNDSTLSDLAQLQLDSFAEMIRPFPLEAFYISGNTDNVGSNHLKLSEARVQSVLQYLQKQHGIQPFRFFRIFNGDKNLATNTQIEKARQLNRKVDIFHAAGSFEEILYRNILIHTFNLNTQEAFRLLSIWLKAVAPEKRIYPIFDPRLAMLQNDKRWNPLVVKKIEASYNGYKKPRLAYLLDSLGREDQKCRTLKYYIENLSAYVPSVDSTEKRFDVHYFPDTAQFTCYCRDEAHFKLFNRINTTGTWPKASEIGQRAAQSVFFLYSHTSDTSAINRAIPLLKKACENGEANWLHYATLYDRFQVMNGKPQRFGTQFKPPQSDTDPLIPFPMEDPGKVNQWRIELGLEPIPKK
jgi:outer membrane protein OmpA-like peptidoglycan-associated protein